MFSAFFIDRPKFALVISLVLTVIGAIAYTVLPVEQFPEITPPVVRVSASFPGASAETLEETVAAPIEGQVNGVDGMLYMSSDSSDAGNYSLNVTFAVGTDADIATVNTQNRVAQATSQLPEEVTRNGVTTEKSSTNMLMMIALSAPEGGYDEVFLSNYATINIKDVLSRVPGVGRADVITNFEYGMRIWLDPDRLAGLGMTPADFVAAIRDQNAIAPAGQIGAPPSGPDQQFQYTVKARGRLADPAEFEQIVLRSGADGTSIVTVGDVARVELGAQVYGFSGRYNGVPATVIGVYQSPGANALAVSEGVTAQLERLSQFFPEGVSYDITFNTTDFVESSLNDVIETLFITFTLVVLVVFLFLGNLRATLIPMVAIPVSLIGTFAVLLMLGMSLNTVSLFALVLAIGIVVDDAIIVVENVEKRIAEGYPPKEATRIAMGEITAPVIATTLVLLAVFVPVTFMPGITGQLYSQFAITISAAVVISSINALTLSPALCGLVLRPRTGPPRGVLGFFERLIDGARNGYVAIVARLARVAAVGLAAVAAAMLATVWLSGAIPSGFLPSEDQGYLMVDVQLPDAASLNRTEAVTARMETILEDDPDIRNVATVNGFSILGGAAPNMALMALTLDNWAERPNPEQHALAVQRRLWGQFDGIAAASIIVFNPPPIPGLGAAAGVEMKVQQVGGGTPQDLAQAIGSLVFSANQRPEIARAYSTYRANVPQVFVDLDRDKAKALHVDVGDVFTTLQAYLGSFYVNDFNLFSRVYKVMIQAEGTDRDRVEDIGNLYVRSQTGDMVPLSTLVTVENILGPMSLNRFNLYRAASVTAEPAPGYSTGDAIAAMAAVTAEALPPGYAFEWTGSAAQELEAGGLVIIILGLAVLFAYLFLVAQYESWSMPVAILLTVTLALFGAYMAVLVTGGDVNLYTQIGMIMLVGLGAKNAILIVEFAMEQRAAGMSIYDAGVTAARLRFRAVMMTALSFLLGVVPLMLASGAGAASQQAIGIAVFGGMVAASTLGVIVTPVLYVAIQSAREWLKRDYRGIHAPLDTGPPPADGPASA